MSLLAVELADKAIAVSPAEISEAGNVATRNTIAITPHKAAPVWYTILLTFFSILLVSIVLNFSWFK